jgi:hypothetical protein
VSRTFTKLFSSITESTVWCEPAHTRLTWIAMLAMADHAGRVFASIPGLANRARVPLDDCERALETFLAPDPYSRTPDYEGRRIEPIDGGWRLLNHAKYRALKDEESVKESKRRYINERRAKERAQQGVENVEPSRSLSAHAEAEAEAEADTSKSKARSKADAPPANRGQRLPASWEPTDDDVKFALQERVNWRRELESFRDYWNAKPGKDAVKLDWSATWRNWIRKASKQPVKLVEQPKSQTRSGMEVIGRMVNGTMDFARSGHGSGKAVVLEASGVPRLGHDRNYGWDVD